MNILQILRLLIKPGTRLSHRVFHAGSWVTTTKVVKKGIGFIRIIILARLLDPTAFGLVGIALLVIGLMESFIEIGLVEALIQRKGDIRGYLNTVWSVYLTLQVILAIVIFTSGSWIATFFNAPEAGLIVRVMSLSLVFGGLNNIGLVYFIKELEFNKRFIYEISIVVVDLAVVIPLAIVLRNAWALVFGTLASTGVGVIMSYILHPYRPKLDFDKNKFKELFVFGKWMLITGLLHTLARRTDSFFIGKILGAPALGLYQIAGRISDEPIREVKSVMHAVTFPTYSKVQDNRTALSQIFLGTIGLLSTVVIPFATVVLFLAPDFTRLVLGEQWMPAVTAIQVLAFASTIRTMTSATGHLYMGVGRPQLMFYLQLISGLVMVICIYPLLKTFGITGAAISLLISWCVNIPIFIWYPVKLLNIKVTQLGKALAPAAVISLAMAIIIVLLKVTLAQVNLPYLIIIGAAGVITYIAMAFLLWRIFKSGPLEALAYLRTDV